MTELMDSEAAAARIGWHPGSMARARVRGDGPPYLKVGRSVRYDPRDIDAWLESRKRNSTSQAA